MLHIELLFISVLKDILSLWHYWSKAMSWSGDVELFCFPRLNERKPSKDCFEWIFSRANLLRWLKKIDLCSRKPEHQLIFFPPSFKLMTKYKNTQPRMGEAQDNWPCSHTSFEVSRKDVQSWSSSELELKVHIWKCSGIQVDSLCFKEAPFLCLEIKSQDNSETLSNRLNVEFVDLCQNASMNEKEEGRRQRRSLSSICPWELRFHAEERHSNEPLPVLTDGCCRD